MSGFAKNGVIYPCGTFLDMLTKNDIATVVNENSTNEQVAGAKAVNDIIYTNTPVTIMTGGTADGFRSALDNYSVNMPNGTHYNARIIANVAITELGNTGGVYYVDGYKTNNNYEYQTITRYDDNGIAMYTRSKCKGMWNKWQRVCTTSVPDVPVTQITSFSDANMAPISNTCCYSVSNGWCFITLEIAINTEKRYDWESILGGSYKIPIPKTTANNTKMVLVSLTGETLVISPQRGTLHMFGDAKSSHYFGSISYPVASE